MLEGPWGAQYERKGRAFVKLRTWLDFEDGTRSDGTLRSYSYIGCLDQALTDRTLYARSLGAKDPAPVKTRIAAMHAKRAKEKANLAELRRKAEG